MNTVTVYHDPDRPNWQPGAEPGLDTTKEEADEEPRLTAFHTSCAISITDFSEESIFTRSANNHNIQAVLDEVRPTNMPCRWISVTGLSWDVIKVIANKFGIHRLAVEDLINTKSRTKVDWYSDHAFAVMTLQKLVHICKHQEEEDCDCDERHPNRMTKIRRDHVQTDGASSPWRQVASRNNHDDDVLPRYESESASPKSLAKAEAEETTGGASPPYIRTLHRYESAHTPVYTEFFERHSVLAGEDLVVSVEQVAIFLMSDNTIISFFEHSGQDVDTPILQRLHSQETMLRRACDASLIFEAIIDTVVDLALPIKDAYNNARKEMQIDVLTNPDIATSKSLYIFSEEIDMLQGLFKPIIHLVNTLRDHQTDPGQGPSPSFHMEQLLDPSDEKDSVYMHRNSPGLGASDTRPNANRRATSKRMHPSTSVVISPIAIVYLGDVLDHALTFIQSLEQMDNSANNLSTLIFNTVGAKTNNFMMILALVTVFFSPLTFISGYFGMNFERFDAIHTHSDAFFWVVALPSVFVFMLVVAGSVFWNGIRNWWIRFSIKRLRNIIKRDKERIQLRNSLAENPFDGGSGKGKAVKKHKWNRKREWGM